MRVCVWMRAGLPSDIMDNKTKLNDLSSPSGSQSSVLYSAQHLQVCVCVCLCLCLCVCLPVCLPVCIQRSAPAGVCACVFAHVYAACKHACVCVYNTHTHAHTCIFCMRLCVYKTHTNTPTCICCIYMHKCVCTSKHAHTASQTRATFSSAQPLSRALSLSLFLSLARSLSLSPSPPCTLHGRAWACTLHGRAWNQGLASGWVGVWGTGIRE